MNRSRCLAHAVRSIRPGPARRIARHNLLVPLLAASGVACAACGGPGEDGSDRTVQVLAAASLTDVLPPLADAWRSVGGARVGFSFDATSRLAPQLAAGAPADLFFSADEAWMDWLEARGVVARGDARVVAGNRLVVVVPRGGMSDVDGPAALPGVRRLAMAGENVPASRYGRLALEAAGVWAEVEPRVVRSGSARSALEWVARGDADAGIVYHTDALAEPRVVEAFGLSATATYLAAVPAGATRREDALAFLDFVAGPDAAAIWAAAGFSSPGLPAPQEVPEPGLQAPPTVAPQPPDPSASSHLPDAASAIRLSLWVALLATVVGFVPAVGLGWLLARREFPGKTLLSGAVLVPLVVPPVVTGFVLLSLLGANAPLGRALHALGVTVPFTLVGAAVAAFVVGLPLYVLSVRGAFEAVDRHYEELSWTLGAPPRRTFARISLPLAVPGIAAGALLAFARALGEFGATVVLAGNVEGDTRTIALAVYTLLEAPTGRGAIWTLVGASVALSLAALVGYETLSRRQRRRLEAR